MKSIFSIFLFFRNYDHTDTNFQTRNNHDIGIMIVRGRFHLTKYVRPICLPKRSFRGEPGAGCIATGWGETETGLGTICYSL